MLKNLTTSASVKIIFDKYVPMVLNPYFFPATAVETLYSRATACYLMSSHREGFNENDAAEAQSLISRTSKDPDDLGRLKTLSENVTHWEEVTVCSINHKVDTTHLEYKLAYDEQNKRQMRHVVGRFVMENNQCKFIDQKAPVIRVIGDPILQHEGILFPNDPTPEQLKELKEQIKIAKEALIETGGGGIAANQCAGLENPYQFTIVGVFNDDPTHVANVGRRYPGVQFPDATIMINPKVLKSSEETMTFPHACLSVPGDLRAVIKNSREITVAYHTFNQQGEIVPAQKTVRDMDAVVLNHELNHIIRGKVYLDCCLAELSSYDLLNLNSQIKRELKRRRNADGYTDLTHHEFRRIVDIDESGETKLNKEVLSQALEFCTTQTLQGLSMRIGFEEKQRKQNSRSAEVELNEPDQLLSASSDQINRI